MNAWRVDRINVRAYRIPTQGGQESDGTAVWDSTVLVLVEIRANGVTGFGYTYADESTAHLVREQLAAIVTGSDPMKHRATAARMNAAMRNLGREGIVAMAISAVDVALWDLKARLLESPLCSLFGMSRNEVPVYGSGGFTSEDETQLREQMMGWVESGILRVKMKVGRDTNSDVRRVALVRDAIGDAELYVDANGAYSIEQAHAFARAFGDSGVTWFEEPVPHYDMDGLRRVRDRVPAGMAVASGEYGYQLEYFARVLRAGAVDVLQADATRCGGFSGLLAVDGLCRTANVPLSTHCAPHLHLHAALACASLRHAEYFQDHARIERMLFDGALQPQNGALHPDLTRPGIGLEFKAKDAEQYLI